MKYNKPEIEIIFLNANDIMSTSWSSGFEVDEWDPFEQGQR